MNDVTKANGGGAILPADFLQKMATGIAESRATTVLGVGGRPLLRMLRNGEFVFGQNNEPVQEGSQWAVNIVSLAHGWVKWVESEKVGESMVSMSMPKPVKPGEGYQEQRSVELRCLDGDDAGTEVRYNTNSYGGLNAFDGLLVAMQNHWTVDPVHVCPVLELHSKPYDHKKYGETFNPVLVIVGWVDMNGNFADDAPQPAAAALGPKTDPKPPTKPRKAPLKTIDAEARAMAEPVLAAEPAPTQRAHTGQRRRPTAV